ncbi:hypothetical protein [Flavihumibacter fluvii]|uniref:hypothetical protein n=1 Tax=Flavihumibacter fluvii TaxID=2838157 RepID=UPI001BDE25C2|nr:hypothetical protein [Flavihumibacter fluvii]ULQ52211.1 hypothetical protein KJS93_19160 [Flavihumibacter fluvii]
MKKTIFLAGLAVFYLSNLVAQNGEPFLVGASSATISPKPGAYIAGGDQNRKFTRVHDNLFVKAVVISSATTSIAIFTVDCIGMLYPQLQQVRELVGKTLPGFPVEHIIMSSTHTHSGPDVVGIWGPDPMHSGVDSLYLREFVTTAAAQIVKAYKNRKSAWALYANTVHGQGWVENISQPAEVDRSVTILQFTNRVGKNIVTLTNFACHPTILDGSSGEVSADYVAGFYESLDKRLGGTNMFLQGAIGGWVQPEHVPKTMTAAYERGYGLANAVLAALKNPQSMETRTLGFKHRLVSLPVANPGFRKLSESNVIQRKITDSVVTEIALFNIGEARFATHPGETVPAMGLATKLFLKTDGPKFVLGLSMDALGYILKPEFFNPAAKIPHSEYLCSMSIGPMTGEIIMGTIEAMARE